MVDEKETNGIEIQVPPRTEYLSLIRHFVKQIIMIEYPLVRGRLETLQLCVSEAVTNSIMAYKNIDITEPIVIRFYTLDDHIDIEIQDRGPGFDLSTFADGNVNNIAPLDDPIGGSEKEMELSEQGRGLALMHEHVDICDISSSSDGTTVRLSIYPEQNV